MADDNSDTIEVVRIVSLCGKVEAIATEHEVIYLLIHLLDFLCEKRMIELF
jgi:hypothetical protein